MPKSQSTDLWYSPFDRSGKNLLIAIRTATYITSRTTLLLFSLFAWAKSHITRVTGTNTTTSYDLVPNNAKPDRSKDVVADWDRPWPKTKEGRCPAKLPERSSEELIGSAAKDSASNQIHRRCLASCSDLQESAQGSALNQSHRKSALIVMGGNAASYPQVCCNAPSVSTPGSFGCRITALCREGTNVGKRRRSPSSPLLVLFFFLRYGRKGWWCDVGWGCCGLDSGGFELSCPDFYFSFCCAGPRE